MKNALTLFAFLFILNSSAQWTTDTMQNTLVVDSEGGDMKAVGTSDGQTYVVFWKVVAPPTNYELRMQVLDANGNQTLGSDGMLVSNTIPMSTFTVIWNIVTDSSNNIYIGVTGTGAGNPAFAFKLDSNGAHLWPSGGVNVGSGFVPTILPLSNGEAVVAWGPGGEAMMQKYSAAGTAVWASPQSIIEAGNDTSPGDLFELAGGDFVVVFHSLIGGINSNLFAQRYSTAGTPQWGTPTQVSNQATAFNRSYGGLQEGDAIYYGYFASSGVRFDSFLQRINADGSLPWGINGSDFDTSQANYEMDTKIAYDSGAQFVYAVCTATNTNQSERGEYVQKFDKDTGARGLTDNAKVVYPIGDEKVHAGRLHLIDGTPWFLIKNGFDNGASPTTLEGIYLDENGEFVWSEETRPVATFAANKSRIQYTTPANNQSVAVFIEDKGAGSRIYAQNMMEEIIFSIDDFESQTMVSYNNPVQELLELRAEKEIRLVEIYDITGKKVLVKAGNGTPELAVETNTLAMGVYVMQLTMAEGAVQGFKIIKL